MQALRTVCSRLIALAGAVGLTLVLFLVLPVIQIVSTSPTDRVTLTSVDTAQLEPPPPVPEEPPQEEPEPEDNPPPELEETAPQQLLTLGELEMALGDGFGGVGIGDINLNSNIVAAQSMDDVALLAELDQRPRVLYQASPRVSGQMRKKTRNGDGTVVLIFVVNKDGTVGDARVQSSTDPVFEGAALAAVKQWKFEPGMRNGEAVRFRMRVPIVFPKGLGS